MNLCADSIHGSFQGQSLKSRAILLKVILFQSMLRAENFSLWDIIRSVPLQSEFSASMIVLCILTSGRSSSRVPLLCVLPVDSTARHQQTAIVLFMAKATIFPDLSSTIIMVYV